jgi:hypothetical protein
MLRSFFGPNLPAKGFSVRILLIETFVDVWPNCKAVKFYFIYFCAIGFNLSNGVTNTFDFSLILIYSELRMGLYTQKWG